MAFTDKCAIFASFHEDGFNRLIGHVMGQRPSLFNYATQYVADHPNLLCAVIKAHSIVTARANPLVTITDPLPIPGSDYGLNFAAQLTELRLDFHPGNQFTLPPELAPLGPQRLALHLTVCGGIGCPPDDVIDQFVPLPDPNEGNDQQKRRQLQAGHPNRTQVGRPDIRPDPQPTTQIKPVTTLPTRELLCFCLDLFGVAELAIRTYYNKPYAEIILHGIEIVDIKPENLENSLECYIKLLLRLVVLPQLRVLLKDITLSIPDLATITLLPTPAPGTVPNNPAVEQDQAKFFIDMEVA
jgi:hypothetical protein